MLKVFIVLALLGFAVQAEIFELAEDVLDDLFELSHSKSSEESSESSEEEEPIDIRDNIDRMLNYTENVILNVGNRLQNRVLALPSLKFRLNERIPPYLRQVYLVDGTFKGLENMRIVDNTTRVTPSKVFIYQTILATNLEMGYETTHNFAVDARIHSLLADIKFKFQGSRPSISDVKMGPAVGVDVEAYQLDTNSTLPQVNSLFTEYVKEDFPKYVGKILKKLIKNDLTFFRKSLVQEDEY